VASTAAPTLFAILEEISFTVMDDVSLKQKKKRDKRIYVQLIHIADEDYLSK